MFAVLSILLVNEIVNDRHFLGSLALFFLLDEIKGLNLISEVPSIF